MTQELKQPLLLFASIIIFFTACTNSSPKTEIAVVSEETKPSSVKQNRLEVYCFHGTRQCETCKNMKANTKTTLDKYFASQLKDSTIVFSIVDVDDSKNEKIAEKFQATGTALMINKVVNGKDSIIDWSDFAFEKANEESEYINELKSKIESALK
ncbi:MAG: nitrophenyl compound nitroreductase subunit ArsF family protein [Bacteroidetes bacterium]|nr:nitrophenyl compound nitroreductase subunit ArsF family protein [Bacteroidota bacterium]